MVRSTVCERVGALCTLTDTCGHTNSLTRIHTNALEERMMRETASETHTHSSEHRAWDTNTLTSHDRFCDKLDVV